MRIQARGAQKLCYLPVLSTTPVDTAVLTHIQFSILVPAPCKFMSTADCMDHLTSWQYTLLHLLSMHFSKQEDVILPQTWAIR